MDITKKVIVRLRNNPDLVYSVLIALLTVLFFLPFYFDPEFITNRGNDLSEEFLPLFSYVKESFWKFHEFPLWQNIVLSGSPILGDPQNAWIYPPYLLSLILPLDYFALVLFMLHFFLAGISTYLLLRSYQFSEVASFAGSLVYMFAPKLISHLEAGHLGMIVAFSLAPVVFLSAKKITDGKGFLWPPILGISAAWMMITYFTVFYYTAFVVGIHFVIWVTKTKKARMLTLLRLAFGVTIAFGISLPQLLAGSEFLPLSNRGSLTFLDIAQPLWSVKKFVFALLFPFTQGFSTWQTEEVLFPGIIPIVMSGIGFSLLSRRLKLLTLSVIIFVLLVSINTRTPFYGFAYHFLPGIKYLRITTRLWFLATLVSTFLSAFALDNLGKRVQFFKRLNYLVVVLLTAELTFWGYLRLNKPYQPPKTLPTSLQQILDRDKTYFRLYCTTGCIPLGKDAPRGVGNVGGYNPVHLFSYDRFLARAGGYSFTGFAPILPPYQTFDQQPQPSAELLGKLSTKYVFSTYPLTDPYFQRLESAEGYLLYKNLLFQPRAYVQSDNGKKIPLDGQFTPNEITFKLNDINSGEIVVSEVYYPAWRAETSSGDQVVIKEKDDIILSVPIQKKAASYRLYLRPRGLVVSLVVMLGIYGSIIIFFLRKIYENSISQYL